MIGDAMPFKRPRTSANDVADRLLILAKRDGIKLDNLKMQKLLYYAQAWSLVERREPLFAERLEAWREGPVVEQVYHRFKSFGESPIDPEAASEADTSLVEQELELIESIWARYGAMSGVELSRMTHAEEPWDGTRGELGPRDRSRKAIDLDDIYRYYSRRLDTENDRLSSLLDIAKELADRQAGSS